jgi:hypothetical protein
MAIAGAFTASVAAGLALPLLEFVALSTRAGLTPADQVADSLPPARLLGIVAPDLGGWPEWATYVGLGVLVLAVAALAARPSRSLFWACVAFAAAILALGSATPTYAEFAHFIPGFDLLRVPARFMLLAAFAVSCLAGNGFDLLAGPPLSHRVASRSRLAVFAVVALAVALSAVLAFSGRLGGTSGGAWGPFVGVVILGAAALGWARLSVTSWLGSRVKAAGWVALVVIDLGWVNLAQLEARPEDEVLGERVELAQTIASGAELERVFSPSYSLPQQTAALEGLELADGVNPLQLASYRDHLAEATGFPVAGYSVTLPPFPSGTPSVPWTVHIDPASLGVLNVATIISEYPLEGQGLEPATRVDGTWVYHNPLVRPRAWVEPTASAVESWIPAVKVVWSPNRISVEAEGPGTLVVSENAYPGWTVTVDGKESELLTVHGLLRGVDLSEGGHEVVFTFRPRSVYVGALLVLGSAVVLLALWRLR